MRERWRVCVCFYCCSEKRCQSSNFEKVLWNVYDKVATITTSVIITRKPLPLQAILCWLCLSGANQAPNIYALNNKLVVVLVKVCNYARTIDPHRICLGCQYLAIKTGKWLFQNGNCLLSSTVNQFYSLVFLFNFFLFDYFAPATIYNPLQYNTMPANRLSHCQRCIYSTNNNEHNFKKYRVCRYWKVFHPRVLLFLSLWFYPYIPLFLFLYPFTFLFLDPFFKKNVAPFDHTLSITNSN